MMARVVRDRQQNARRWQPAGVLSVRVADRLRDYSAAVA